MEDQVFQAASAPTSHIPTSSKNGPTDSVFLWFSAMVFLWFSYGFPTQRSSQILSPAQKKTPHASKLRVHRAGLGYPNW